MSQLQARDNLAYMEALWQQYKQNPQSVERDWYYFFQGLEFAGVHSLQEGFSEMEWALYRWVQAYRQYAYLEADLDPLTNSNPSSLEILKKESYGLSDEDLDREFAITESLWGQRLTLKQVIEKLDQTYRGALSVQVGHCYPEVQAWFYEQMEKSSYQLSPEQKKKTFLDLTKTEVFEKFLHRKFVGAKRFSAEGAESMVPMLEHLADLCVTQGVEDLVMGMPHRGRLAVLVNFFEKPAEAILGGYLGQEGDLPFEEFDSDVKYHWGYQKTKKLSHGELRVHLASNPSHLEAVNPVVLGMARAAQRLRKDTEQRKKVLPVLFHGDAAFAGQGIVQETLQMSSVRGYRVGGTLHVVVDNQVGFTTNPENGRSTPYSTDVLQAVGAPIIHVNGDHVEAVLRAIELAFHYRQKWGRDVGINLVCYRRYGHNEGDEPGYTQPLMYKMIQSHPPVREIYAKKLVSEGLLNSAEVDSAWQQAWADLEAKLEQVKTKPVGVESFSFQGPWQGLRRDQPSDWQKDWDTSFPVEKLREIGVSIAQVPQGFNPHPKIAKLLEQRQKMAQGELACDWGMAELLAFGSLLEQGYHVRLTGQDCIRGTFSHRHAGLYDYHTGEPFMALKTRFTGRSEFCVYDSILSEYGVLGFEYGNSIYDPRFLTLWEAQFGDFGNGAQIMIDQFISSGEMKWQQMSGLVMLLPHGYEGQGPEHSSARLERYLQLSAQNNWQVVVPTTASQIFHLYRRQMLRPFRKPLVVMSPKSLLRLPQASSMITDLASGRFEEVLADSVAQSKSVQTLLLCSGKIYYELDQYRQEKKFTHAAIVRLEQLYPFPAEKLLAVIRSYPQLKNLIWVQEEPKNMGAYQFVYFKLADLLFKEKLGHLAFHYVGRGERASTATGLSSKHQWEQKQIIEGAFSL